MKNSEQPTRSRLFPETAADSLGGGQSIEEVEPKFTPTMHPTDWATIRGTTSAQAVPKIGK